MSNTAVDVSLLRPAVEQFCGDCHATPRPDYFPRRSWRKEVERGFDFYYESFRADLAAPVEDDVVAYYESLAPEELGVELQKTALNSIAAQRFERAATAAPQLEPPAVSFIDWLKLPGDEAPRIVFCDMRSGEIHSVSFAGAVPETEILTVLKNPARLAVGDLNNDGQQELVAAELGSFTSADHRQGAVVWLRRDTETGAWSQRLLVSGLGRVADIRPGDLDGDGDIDLAVAEFGHLVTGRVLVFENTGVVGGIPQFREHVVDPRHGAIHVPLADMNGDGRLDIVALISQEHETIVALLNEGEFQFRGETIFGPADPAYGSSGIELADMDNDGDLDVLYTNGDTFGADDLKPYHGISWLENRSGYPFVEHRLAAMVGVQRAAPIDLDGDGDLDVVAVGFMPSNLVSRPQLADHASVIWIEQQADGRFQSRGLEQGYFRHAALACGDFDDDGDADLAIGNFQDLATEHAPWLTMWWNRPVDGSSP